MPDLGNSIQFNSYSPVEKVRTPLLAHPIDRCI